MLDLVDQGLDERLLELDAAEVGAVADAVPGADEAERLLSVEGVRAAWVRFRWLSGSLMFLVVVTRTPSRSSMSFWKPLKSTSM